MKKMLDSHPNLADNLANRGHNEVVSEQDAPVGSAKIVAPAVPEASKPAAAVNPTGVTERPGNPAASAQGVSDPREKARQTLRSTAQEIRRQTLVALQYGDIQRLLDLYVLSPSAVGATLKAVWREGKRQEERRIAIASQRYSREAREAAAEQCKVELRRAPGMADDFEDGSGDYLKGKVSTQDHASGRKPIDVVKVEGDVGYRPRG